MSNEIILLIEKFIEDNCELLAFSQEDIYSWCLTNMDSFYSSKYYLFNSGLKGFLNSKPNKLFSMNWNKIKILFKNDSKKFDELQAKHKKANKL